MANTAKLGEFQIVATPFHSGKTRYTVTHLPTKYVKMDSALPTRSLKSVLKEIVEWCASENPVAEGGSLHGFATPIMIDKENQVHEAAKTALGL